LATEERGDLEYVADFGGRIDLEDVVDIGEDRQPRALLYGGQNAQALYELRAAERGNGGAVGLVVRGFEDVGDFQIGGDGGDFFGHAGGVGFGFDHAGAGDQEERGVRAELDVGDREAARWWHVWANGCGNRLCGNGWYFNFEL
jgi:hypothetical protein